MNCKYFLLRIIQFFSIQFICSLKHKLTITNDDRSLFKIETFGFIKGGVLDIKISNFNVILDKENKKKKDISQYKLGFIGIFLTTYA